MAAAKVYSMDGKEQGSVDLTDAIFDVPLNEGLVHEVAVALQGAQRQGNAETKTRKEIRGGGAKPYRQKGTGSARRGSIREPHMRGGGVVFGPHRRSYRKKVTPNVKRHALCCALSDSLRTETLCVLDSVACEQPKTKVFAELLTKLSADGKATLFVMPDVNTNAILSVRNLQKVEVKTATDLNALDVLKAARVVLVSDAIAKLEERLL
jgi:large subunit ribosomal protein L4